jgi:plasmid stabilization system protein ParE
MELRWTEAAADDLEQITNYLFEKAPAHAAELVREIYHAPSALLSFPYRGRPGRSPEMSSTLLAFSMARRSGLNRLTLH